MKVGRGRVISANDCVQAQTLVPQLSRTLPDGRVLAREVVEAAEHATRLVAQAELRAAQIIAQAEQESADLRLRAEAEGRADAAASIAARALAQTAHEARADERALDRSIELARILAERLLGESLRVAPEQVISLARQVLSEARGARRIRLLAHPDDVAILARALPTVGVDAALTELVPVERARGSLRIETEIGVLDADLAPQLERLTLKLRESLEHG